MNAWLSNQKRECHVIEMVSDIKLPYLYCVGYMNGILAVTSAAFIFLDDMNDYTLIPPMPPMDTFMANMAADGDMICIDIAITDDDDYEADHTFSLAIQLSLSPTTSVPVSPTLATVIGGALITIQDNGGKYNIHKHVHLSIIQGS